MKADHRAAFCLFLIVGFSGFAHAADAEVAASRPNVLFIAIDDLRPALGCYGDKTAVTPNIDRLASRGTVFRRAYCQQAVCCPSRLSLLTGRRPDTIRVWDLATHFRDALPDVVTLPQFFKNHGYHTRSIGKIYHGGGKPSKDPPSWSVPPQHDSVRDPKVRYALPENRKGKGLKRSAAEAADVPDNAYIDGIVCDAALAALAALEAQGHPFFLAVGFRKPHLPFCAPQKYWDLYDRLEIPLPVTTKHPQDAPELAVRSWKELEGYTDVPEDGQLSPEKVRELRHGYYACVSYVDALVGRLLGELEQRAMTESTVVVLWGDHGYHLGEQGLWTKANNYELSTRVPLILSAPGQARLGAETDALVELVDVYPTLADVCRLGAPVGVEGTSLKPLLDAPTRSWKQAVFSQYPRARKSNRHRGHGDVMGYAVRTQRYRYVEWREWETRRVVARELYDHGRDPNEMHNTAKRPEQADIVRRLAGVLEDGWTDPGCPDGAAKRPNILLIVSEDNGPELGCYGEPFVKTPVLDKLAADGVRFHNAYVPQAGCSQSRAAFLTGLYPHQNGQIGLATWKFRMYRGDTPNMVRSLKAAGYRTGIIGKLHVNPESAFPFDKKEIPSSNFGRKNLNDYAGHAEDFFNASDVPFFLSVNYPDAHRPFVKQVRGLPERPLAANDVKPLAYFGLDTPQLRADTADYYNCMNRLDSLVGELLDALRRSGKAENTLIVYLGDHGADLLRGKRTSYEGGVRVPLIVHWPGRVKPKQVRRELVSTLDLMPTLLAVAEAEPVAHLPGRSLVPLLQDEETEWRRYLFTEYHTHSAHNFYPQRTVRNARYKLIQNLMPGQDNPGYDYTLKRFFPDLPRTIEAAPDHIRASYRRMKTPPEYELYDLETDPYEFRNLAADIEHAAALAVLREQLAAWRAQTNDPLLDPENMRRLKAEIDACLVEGEARKPQLTLTYPDYFLASESKSEVGDINP